MSSNFSKSKQFLAVLLCTLIITASLTPLFARKAEAQWVVFDPANFTVNTITSVNTTLQGPVKEFGLDSIAWILVNMIIERMAASTVNWINSGFKGSPAFISDPSSYYKGIGDGVAGQIIYNHPDLRFMCAPLRAKVQIALTQSYVQPFGNYQCTLSGVVNNFDNFIDDFYQGGWDGFIEVTQKSQNNPLGLYNQAQNEVNVSVGSALGQKQAELAWGRGFLTFEDCQTTTGESSYINSEGIPETSNTSSTHCDVKTPGSVIENSLNNALHLSTGRLQVADEINEIVSALLSQLVSKAIGAVGSGLRSLSSPDPSNGNRVYTDDLQNETANNNNINQVNSNTNNTLIELQNSIGTSGAAGQAITNQSNQVLNQILPTSTSGFQIP